MHRWTLATFAALVALAGLMLAVRLLNTPRPEGLILYVVQADELRVAAASLTGWRSLEHTISDKVEPQWSPDGQEIAYSINLSVFRTRLNDSQNGVTGETRIRTFPRTVERIQWSPDGEILAYTENRHGLRLRLHHLETGTTDTVFGQPVQNVWGFDFSPDGERVAALVTSADDTGHLYIVPVGQTGPLTRISYEEGFEQSPTYSPDGRRLAFFLSPRRNNLNTELVIIGLNTGWERRFHIGARDTDRLLWPHGRTGPIYGADDWTTYSDGTTHLVLAQGIPLDTSQDGEFLLYQDRSRHLCTLWLDRPSVRKCSRHRLSLEYASWQP